jgi:hypothetical protein
MKSPDNRTVEKVKLRMRANARIEEALRTGRKHNADWLELELLDKVMRPFSLALTEERYRQGSDANEMRQIVAQYAANMLVEAILQIAERDQPEEAIKWARIMLGELADNLATCMQVNYGLTPGEARANVDSTPQTGGSA